MMQFKDSLQELSEGKSPATQLPKAIHDVSFPSPSFWCLTIYVATLLLQPEQRFPILGHIRYQLILIAICFIVTLIEGRLLIPFSKMHIFLALFYLSQFVSYLLSPYRTYSNAVWWLDNYWKYFPVYIILVASLSTVRRLRYFVLTLVAIAFLYQAYSWLDFLRGGSYVYQQGTKRIIGVWSGSDLGAANQFAVFALFPIPFARYLLMSSKRVSSRLLGFLCLALSTLTIVFSATRAAMLAELFYGLIIIRKLKHFVLIVLVAAIILGVLYAGLPDALRYRYFGFLDHTPAPVNERIQQIQSNSARSRLQGFIDGWELGLKRPIWGWGPGSSPIARHYILGETQSEEGRYLQLHNLYGQLVSEIGLIGTALFLVLLAIFFADLGRSNKSLSVNSLEGAGLGRAIREVMIVWLFYGLAAHSLFHFQWFILWGLHQGIVRITKDSSAEMEKISEA